jgi:hypothetical protein
MQLDALNLCFICVHGTCSPIVGLPAYAGPLERPSRHMDHTSTPVLHAYRYISQRVNLGTKSINQGHSDVSFMSPGRGMYRNWLRSTNRYNNNSSVFWDVKPYAKRRFGGMCCLHLQGRIMSHTSNREEQATNRVGWRTMEAMLFCRTSADF